MLQIPHGWYILHIGLYHKVKRNDVVNINCEHGLPTFLLIVLLTVGVTYHEYDYNILAVNGTLSLI